MTDIVLPDKAFMLLLVLIAPPNGIKDIYTLVKVLNRASFPFALSEKLQHLLDHELIAVTSYFDNGTASKYTVTDKGHDYLTANLDALDVTSYVTSMEVPEPLLSITTACLAKLTKP